MEHPTLGRRRRRKSPSALQSAPLLPVPRLADHLDTDVGPSDEEGGKEAKRQKSEPTTPISTPSRPQMSMTRLWESLKWIQGKLKGLRRGWNRNSKLLKKDHRTFLAITALLQQSLELGSGVCHCFCSSPLHTPLLSTGVMHRCRPTPKAKVLTATTLLLLLLLRLALPKMALR